MVFLFVVNVDAKTRNRVFGLIGVSIVKRRDEGLFGGRTRCNFDTNYRRVCMDENVTVSRINAYFKDGDERPRRGTKGNGLVP